MFYWPSPPLFLFKTLCQHPRMAVLPKGNCSKNMSSTGKNRLVREIKMLEADPCTGIKACLSTDESGGPLLDVWDIYISMPEGLYEEHTLHAKMTFPENYPFFPPTFRFLTPMFHPNIYEDGNVCISILHVDGEGPADMAYEGCTWTPGQNVRTVCLSIMSLLNSPNIYSPANVDASKLFRDSKEEYEAKVQQLLEQHATNQNIL